MLQLFLFLIFLGKKKKPFLALLLDVTFLFASVTFPFSSLSYFSQPKISGSQAWSSISLFYCPSTLKAYYQDIFLEKTESRKEYSHASYENNIFTPFLWSGSSREGKIWMNLPGI